jgi:hypothetical protein
MGKQTKKIKKAVNLIIEFQNILALDGIEIILNG